MQLNHINIQAPRELLEREKTFFCDVLGLREGSRPNLSSEGYWLYSEDKAIIHLNISETHFNNEDQGFLDHVAFQSSNLKNLIQSLKQNEIDYSIAFVTEFNMTQIFLKTPTNTGIEINFINEKI